MDWKDQIPDFEWIEGIVALTAVSSLVGMAVCVVALFSDRVRSAFGMDTGKRARRLLLTWFGLFAVAFILGDMLGWTE